MRTILLGLSALTAVVALTTARADAQGYPVYPWCAEYSRLIGGAILVNGTGGGTNCYFSTLSQCQLAVSGVGGLCVKNPFYGYAGYPADQPRSARKPR